VRRDLDYAPSPAEFRTATTRRVRRHRPVPNMRRRVSPAHRSHCRPTGSSRYRWWTRGPKFGSSARKWLPPLPSPWSRHWWRWTLPGRASGPPTGTCWSRPCRGAYTASPDASAVGTRAHPV